MKIAGKELLAIDFEYRKSNEELLDLVAVSFSAENETPKTYWLHNHRENIEKVAKILETLRKTHVLLCFNATAEGQSLIALGLDPLSYQWVDLQTEYKQVINRNFTLEYGRHLYKGKEIFTAPKPPKWEDEGLQKDPATKPSTSLASALFKICKVKIDSEHKDATRDLILSGISDFNQEQQNQILNYCESDIKYLFDLYRGILRKTPVTPLLKDPDKAALDRGCISALCSRITSNGYPINVYKVRKVREALPQMTKELCEDINSQVEEPLFKWNNRDQKYSERQKRIKEMIEEKYPDLVVGWKRTDKGFLSLDADFIKDTFNIKHSYKPGNFIHQYIRYKDFRKSTSSLDVAKEARKDLFVHIGSDERVRTYLNPYGSKTSRFQPGSSAYMFLKSAWIRALIEPKPGRAIIGCDYGSQEFLIQACISQDRAMYDAYKSGDVYSSFGRKVGIVTAEKGSQEFKLQRQVAKAAVLGISYGMGAERLGLKITQEAKETSKEQAQELIDGFYSLYNKYAEFREKTLGKFYACGGLVSIDGQWILYGDENNKNTILNFLIQSSGAAILRRALWLGLKRGLKIVAPLHDAVYLECDKDRIGPSLACLHATMKEASGAYFEGDSKLWARDVRLEFDVWGPGVGSYAASATDLKQQYNVSFSDLYIDPRGREEYETFKKYWESQ